MAEHAIELPHPPEEALAAVGQAAEEWGAEFERQGRGGRLRLPVVAGLRRGLLVGPLTVEAAGAGSRLVFRPERPSYSLQLSAVGILLLAAAGALATVLWPFYPALVAVAPFGAVLALGGWFLVVSRLRTSGPAEFLELVAAVAAHGDEGV
jgi:hypothetical protein